MLAQCHFLIVFKMNSKRLAIFAFATTLSVLLFTQCKKDEEIPNPYDETTETQPTITNGAVIPNSNFAWLQERVFEPTCANSGCHDGTFEPDFRSISSSYNSLVYHPVIQNDPQNSFTYRVVPGDATSSLLYERLVNFIPNTSGIMPLAVEPESDWPTYETTYIDAIATWINDGALDVFGNGPSQGNLNPQVDGLLAFPTGTTTSPYPRATGNGIQPIEVPQGSTIDVWFALSDDSTQVTDLTVNELKVSTLMFDFTGSATEQMQIVTPISGSDFSGGTSSFTHRGTLDLSAHQPGTVLYLRTYVQDESHTEPAEIPNDGTNAQLRDWFTLIII